MMKNSIKQEGRTVGRCLAGENVFSGLSVKVDLYFNV